MREVAVTIKFPGFDDLGFLAVVEIYMEIHSLSLARSNHHLRRQIS